MMTNIAKIKIKIIDTKYNTEGHSEGLSWLNRCSGTKKDI